MKGHQLEVEAKTEVQAIQSAEVCIQKYLLILFKEDLNRIYKCIYLDNIFLTQPSLRIIYIPDAK